MKPELRDRWADALESGHYTQARGSMRLKDENKRISYCCLGVLCNLVKDEPEIAERIRITNDGRLESFGKDRFGVREHWFGGRPSYEVQEFLGLTIEQIDECIQMNDHKRWGFSQIAYWIRKNL